MRNRPERYEAEWVTKQHTESSGEWNPDKDEYGASSIPAWSYRYCHFDYGRDGDTRRRTVNNPLAEIVDVLFNGRPASQPEAQPQGKPRVVLDVATLVAKKSVAIIYKRKLYRITCTETTTKETV